MNYEDKQQVTEAIQRLADAVNGWSSPQVAAVMLETLTTQHRTLQQSLVSAIKIMLEGYAGMKDEWFDLRNQEAHQWAKKVREISDSPSRTLPGRLPVL